MKTRIKKTLLALLIVFAMVGVSACSNNANNTGNGGNSTGDNTEGDNTTEDNIGEQTSDGSIVDQYNVLLENETDGDKIYGFIDENITDLSEADADQLIAGVLTFEDSYEDVDYKRLYAYKNYVSDEVEDFLELMNENTEKPYKDGDGIAVTLDELLDRAEDFEKHITEFPDGITTEPSLEMYNNLMVSAITGGYDKENNVDSLYKGDADNRIDGRAVDEYMNFLSNEVEDGDDDQVDSSSNNANNSSNSNNGANTNNNAGNNTGNTTANNNGTASNTTDNNANNASTNNANINNNTNNGINNNTNNNTNNGTNNNTTNNTNANSSVNVGDDSEETFTAPITRQIVQEYVDLLVDSNNEITTEVETFYIDLPSLIIEKFNL